MTILPPYDAPYKPVPQITPFTYRDGVTMLKKVDGIVKYINRELVPFVNENYSELADAFETQVNLLIAAVNAAIAAVIEDSIQVQDPVVAGIVEDEDSLTTAALEFKYALKNVVDSINTIITSGRLSESELDAAYAAKTEFDAIADIIETGRLSEAYLDNRYEPKGNDDNKIEKYPAYNINAESLRQSNIAIARALMGGLPANILCIGDSTTQGAETVRQSWPTYLIDAMRRVGIDAGYGIIAPATNIPDDHWGVTPGWTISQSIGPAGGTFRSAAGNTNQLYAAPKEDYTSISFHYVKGTGGNSAIDKAGVVIGAINSATGTPNTYAVETFNTSGDGDGPDDVFGISGPTGGPINVLGFSWHNSADPREVLVHNFGQSGVQTSDWVSDTMSLDAITYVNPDLTFIMLGINDSIQNVTVENYLSRMITIITKAKLYGDVVVVGFAESDPAFQVGIGPLQDSYEEAIMEYCSENNIPYVDVNGRTGGYSNYVTNDWYRDQVHQGNEANMSIALALTNIIV